MTRECVTQINELDKKSPKYSLNALAANSVLSEYVMLDVTTVVTDMISDHGNASYNDYLIVHKTANHLSSKCLFSDHPQRS